MSSSSLDNTNPILNIQNPGAIGPVPNTLAINNIIPSTVVSSGGVAGSINITASAGQSVVVNSPIIAQAGVVLGVPTTPPPWSATTTYSSSSQVSYANAVWQSQIANNLANVPGATSTDPFSSKKYTASALSGLQNSQVGIKLTTSQQITITQLKYYRVATDTATTHTMTVYSADGLTILAQGATTAPEIAGFNTIILSSQLIIAAGAFIIAAGTDTSGVVNGDTLTLGVINNLLNLTNALSCSGVAGPSSTFLNPNVLGLLPPVDFVYTSAITPWISVSAGGTSTNNVVVQTGNLVINTNVSAWSSTTNYAVGSSVSYSGAFWTSNINSNIGNPPSIYQTIMLNSVGGYQSSTTPSLGQDYGFKFTTNDVNYVSALRYYRTADDVGTYPGGSHKLYLWSNSMLVGTYDGSGYSFTQLGENPGQEFGYTFTANSALVVTALRVYHTSGMAATSHTISLWDAAGNLLGRASTFAEVAGFNVALLTTPITLTSGGNYVISFTIDSSTQCAVSTTSPSYPQTFGGITQTGSVYNFTSGAFPNKDAGAVYLIGVDFCVGSAANPLIASATTNESSNQVGWYTASFGTDYALSAGDYYVTFQVSPSGAFGLSNSISYPLTTQSRVVIDSFVYATSDGAFPSGTTSVSYLPPVDIVFTKNRNVWSNTSSIYYVDTPLITSSVSALNLQSSAGVLINGGYPPITGFSQYFGTDTGITSYRNMFVIVAEIGLNPYGPAVQFQTGGVTGVSYNNGWTITYYTFRTPPVIIATVSDASNIPYVIKVVARFNNRAVLQVYNTITGVITQVGFGVYIIG